MDANSIKTVEWTSFSLARAAWLQLWEKRKSAAYLSLFGFFLPLLALRWTITERVFSLRLEAADITNLIPSPGESAFNLLFFGGAKPDQVWPLGRGFALAHLGFNSSGIDRLSSWKGAALSLDSPPPIRGSHPINIFIGHFSSDETFLFAAFRHHDTCERSTCAHRRRE